MFGSGGEREGRKQVNGSRNTASSHSQRQPPSPTMIAQRPQSSMYRMQNSILLAIVLLGVIHPVPQVVGYNHAFHSPMQLSVVSKKSHSSRGKQSPYRPFWKNVPSLPSSSSSSSSMGSSSSSSVTEDSKDMSRIRGSTSSFLPTTTWTADGYGMFATAQRILNESSLRKNVNNTNDDSNNNKGYYRASRQDTVTDVMANILEGPYDVALVFEDEENDTQQRQLIGLFTETDYIQYSTERTSMMVISNENDEEVQQFVASAFIQDYVTPTTQLFGLLPDDTAKTAIAIMQQYNIRHMVITDRMDDSSERYLSNNSTILGVISMQDVMSILQNDERVSIQESLYLKYPNIPDPLDRFREELKNEANSLSNNPLTAKEDIIKGGAALLATMITAAFFSQSIWLHEHADAVMIAIFVLGYIGIIFEEVFEFNKAGVALLMSTGLWITYADYFDSAGTASSTVLEQLSEQLAEVSDICFFLLAASTIVEVVDSHQGFRVVTNQITTTSKKELFWTIGFLTFFLSSILNNLTVTIVMVSLLRKLIPNDEDRRLFGAMVVVAANAGGVWTPIGDVTTTMLWINNQLSIVCLVSSLAFLVQQVKEDDSLLNAVPTGKQAPLSRRGQLVFAAGIASLLAVPVFNELTGLPPYLAMLTGLGAMWTLTDIIHMGEEEGQGLKVPAALEKLDTSGILFFLGILMSIGVLDKSGLLKELAVYLSDTLPSLDIIATAIGLFSALIDNVPLVAATMYVHNLRCVL
jgi:Na+/H+ antiporter NhaD/arsenite permease-like protein